MKKKDITEERLGEINSKMNVFLHEATSQPQTEVKQNPNLVESIKMKPYNSGVSFSLGDHASASASLDAEQAAAVLMNLKSST